MPRAKPKTCHKCGQMYTGWKCPRCYRKAARRPCSGVARGYKRMFNASSVLGHAALAPVNTAAAAAAAPADEYGESRICRHCGFLTTTHLCTYCGKE